MKIGFIELQPIPSTIGGGSTHLVELGKALIRKGHTPVVITTMPNDAGYDAPKEFFYEGIFFIRVGMKHKKMEDFKGGWKKLLYYIWRPFFEMSFVLGTRKVLRREYFDVIDAQSPISTSLPCSIWGYGYFITCHGIHNEGFKNLYKAKGNWFVSKIGGFVYSILEKYNIKRCKKVICLGKETYDCYSKSKDSVIIPNGVDAEKFKFNPENRKKILLSVGRLTEQKAIDKLVLAMNKLPDYKLVIIGGGDMEVKIKQMCLERKNCELLGFKNHEEIIKHMQKARFLVIPSLFEGLPITLLEGMSCGCIPIMTNVGEKVLTEGTNGFFLKDNSPDEISHVVKVAEKNDMERVRTNCRQLIEDVYNWDNIAGEYLKAWK
jgi:glycosyltransferase involved in cell wall biosynthesis